MFDLKSIKPHKVSRDLTGKSFLIYGDRKVGKTTCASKFPKPLILGYEKGWDDIDDVNAVPINSWKEGLEIKKALIKDAKDEEDSKAKGGNYERQFITIVTDTVDLAYDMCERYVLDREGVEYLDETEKMRGYRAVSREYDKFFQEIVKAGYTLVCISHATTKQVKENGKKYDKTIPTLPDRGFLVVSRLVDVCGYATFEDEPEDPMNPKRILILRGSKELEAGCRNRYMPREIPFTYEDLKEAYLNAIDKMREENPDGVVEKAENLYADKETDAPDFKTLVSEIKKYAKVMNANDLMNDYGKIVAEYLGKGRNVMDCDDSQTDMLILIRDDLKDYFAEHDLSL